MAPREPVAAQTREPYFKSRRSERPRGVGPERATPLLARRTRRPSSHKTFSSCIGTARFTNHEAGKSYGDVLREYEYHPEAKCADATGAPCRKQTVGLLGRRESDVYAVFVDPRRRQVGDDDSARAAAHYRVGAIALARAEPRRSCSPMGSSRLGCSGGTRSSSAETASCPVTTTVRGACTK